VPGSSGRVLVVDDNKVIRQLIRVNLELEGFEVVTAADGAECLDIVHRVRPDAITLDVVMPRLDGLRTAARLHTDPRTRHIPVAIVSACTQLELDNGRSAGVTAFLAKPFEPVDLVRVVRQLVRPSDALESSAASDGRVSESPSGGSGSEPCDGERAAHPAG
jgi:CheY-like chemotaxis protein